MGKKKRLRELQEAERIRLEQQAKVQRARPVMTASWRKINNCGPVPIAPPADFIQLTPIVQPIPLVPYSTQLQPLATFDDEDFD